jgi:hypothetical protein
MVIKVIAIRIIPGSTPKYSASPPHTPAIFDSVDERIRRLGPTRFGADASTWRAPQNEQKFEDSTISFRQFGQTMKSSLRLRKPSVTQGRSLLLIYSQLRKEVKESCKSEECEKIA